MKSIQSFPNIFIATQFADFRLGIQGAWFSTQNKVTKLLDVWH